MYTNNTHQAVFSFFVSFFAVLTLSTNASASSAEMCLKLFGDEASQPKLIQEINSKVATVQSAEALAQVFKELAQLSIGDQPFADRVAAAIVVELKLDGAKKVIESILLSDNPKRAINSLIGNFDYLPKPLSIESINANCIHPVDPVAFVRWSNRGKQLTNNKKFHQQLEAALINLSRTDLNFQLLRGVSADRLASRAIELLGSLNSPLRVGQLMEVLEGADARTKQYLLSQLFQVDSMQTVQRPSFAFRKPERDKDSDATSVVNSILRTSMEDHQVDAYWTYQPGRNSASEMPGFPDLQTQRQVTIRFLSKYIDASQLSYKRPPFREFQAAELLAQHPVENAEIDLVLSSFLKNTSEIKISLLQAMGASLEIAVVIRFEKGLSTLTKDQLSLSHLKLVLETQNDANLLYVKIINFHFSYGLNKYPELARWLISCLNRTNQTFTLSRYLVAGGYVTSQAMSLFLSTFHTQLNP